MDAPRDPTHATMTMGTSRLLAAATLLTVAVPSALTGQLKTDNLPGRWEGTIGVGASVAPIAVVITRDGSRMRGSFDAPEAGVLEWPLVITIDTATTIRMRLPTGWTLQGSLAREHISGTVQANGKTTRFFLRRVKPITLPYKTQDVVFQSGALRSAGTVYSPLSGGRHPAVIFAHGSGEVDRTADLFLGDFLARHGIVVLLYDKRGVGSSSGDWRGTSLDTLAGDALAGVELLRARSDVDPKRVGVAGRSQGGQLAIIAASRSADVAFAIDISGSLVHPWQQMNYEAAASMKRDNMSAADSGAAQAFLKQKWNVAQTGEGWDALSSDISRLRADNTQWLSYVQVPDKLTDITGSWQGQMGYDYQPVLALLDKPLLALFGDRDTSTPVAETVQTIHRSINSQQRRKVTIRVFEKADHALLIWRSREEFALPKYPPGYPSILAQWIYGRIRN
jgi:pimeloyl-ACP methyl ester carboxylesterase